MIKSELVSKIDSTILKPQTLIRDVMTLCIGGLKHKFASICIPPSYVEFAKEFIYPNRLVIGTVIGFPFGYTTTKVKIIEAERAIFDGAEELDMVMNITAFKSKNYIEVLKDIEKIVKQVKGIYDGIIVKVIIECCYLNDKERDIACDLVAESGADYVKTSTGFGTGGATQNDVYCLKQRIVDKNYSLKIKAAGGIKRLIDAVIMIKSGADRLGTSNGETIINEFDFETQNNA